jgi:hypothetical protein
MAHRARPLYAFLKTAASAPPGCPAAVQRRPAVARFAKGSAKTKLAARTRAILWCDGVFG